MRVAQARPRTGSEGFRPDLEGLRGIAILLVLLFHADVPGATGGFVGVDVFFVLSGFLITGLLIRERERTGRVDLAAFYARRARRILPAAAAVLVVTLAASILVVAPLDLPGIAGDAGAAALSIGNIRFALTGTEYFGADRLPSPVLHYWSLGVEEQFYLVWPALLIVAMGARRGRRTLGALLVAVVVGSYAAALVLTQAAPAWAFYSLPTRAWELGLGGLLAATGAWHARLPDAALRPIGWLGLAAVVASLVVIGPATPYPGVAALLPALGSAAVVLAGDRRGSVGGLLSIRPLRFLGLTSYSLYLVHWPLLILPTAGLAVGETLPLEARLGLAGLAVVLGALSYALIERPFHRGRLVWPARPTLARAGAAIAAVVALSVGVGTTAQASLDAAALGPLPSAAASLPPASLPTPTPETAAASALATATPAPTRRVHPSGPQPLPADVQPALRSAVWDEDALRGDKCVAGQTGTFIPDCAYGDPAGGTVVAVVGDSHAAQWFPALDPIAKARGWKLVPFLKLSCRFIDMSSYSYYLRRSYTECDQWRELVVARLQALRPAFTIVSFIDDRETSNAADRDPVHQGQAFARLLDRVPGPKAIIVDTPSSPYDVPVCISRNVADVTACETPSAKAFGAVAGIVERTGADATGSALIDLGDLVCPFDPCPVVLDGMIVYRDSHHLTATFARSLTTPLAAALDAAVAAMPPP